MPGGSGGLLGVVLAVGWMVYMQLISKTELLICQSKANLDIKFCLVKSLIL